MEPASWVLLAVEEDRNAAIRVFLVMRGGALLFFQDASVYFYFYFYPFIYVYLFIYMFI